MTPPLVAGIALAFVSCLGNFGIPAFLGIPGGYLVLPTLIYQRLAGLGPGVLSDVAVLSMLIGAIATAGILLQDVMLRRRDFRIVTTSKAARAFELGRARLPVEVALWTLTFVVLVLPMLALALTSLVPAVGVALTRPAPRSRTTASCCSSTMRRGAPSSTASGSLPLAALAIVVIAVPLAYFVVWRRSRLLRAVNLVAELPYALPGVVLAIAAILLFLKPLPVLGVTLYNTVWIILFGYLARFLVLGLRPVVERLPAARPDARGSRADRRRAPAAPVAHHHPAARGARSRGRRAADLPHRVQRADGVGAAVVVGRGDARRHGVLVPAGRRLRRTPPRCRCSPSWSRRA